MKDTARRTIRTFLQAFLGLFIPGLIALNAAGTPITGAALWALIYAALLAGFIALLALVQNWVEATNPSWAVFKPEAKVLKQHRGKIPGEGKK